MKYTDIIQIFTQLISEYGNCNFIVKEIQISPHSQNITIICNNDTEIHADNKSGSLTIITHKITTTNDNTV